MPNYKKMYLKLFRATEQAIKTLVQIQLECEELYIRQPEPDLKVLSISRDNTETTEP